MAAHVALPTVETSASPLISALYRKGWIRPHRPGSRHVHGIDVDSDQHPIDAGGRSEPRVWVLGPLCEGATFYNNLVPLPGMHSRPVFRRAPVCHGDVRGGPGAGWRRPAGGLRHDGFGCACRACARAS